MALALDFPVHAPPRQGLMASVRGFLRRARSFLRFALFQTPAEQHAHLARASAKRTAKLPGRHAPVIDWGDRKQAAKRNPQPLIGKSTVPAVPAAPAKAPAILSNELCEGPEAEFRAAALALSGAAPRSNVEIFPREIPKDGPHEPEFPIIDAARLANAAVKALRGMAEFTAEAGVNPVIERRKLREAAILDTVERAFDIVAADGAQEAQRREAALANLGDVLEAETRAIPAQHQAERLENVRQAFDGALRRRQIAVIAGALAAPAARPGLGQAQAARRHWAQHQAALAAERRLAVHGLVRTASLAGLLAKGKEAATLPLAAGATLHQFPQQFPRRSARLRATTPAFDKLEAAE